MKNKNLLTNIYWVPSRISRQKAPKLASWTIFLAGHKHRDRPRWRWKNQNGECKLTLRRVVQAQIGKDQALGQLTLRFCKKKSWPVLSPVREMAWAQLCNRQSWAVFSLFRHPSKHLFLCKRCGSAQGSQAPPEGDAQSLSRTLDGLEECLPGGMNPRPAALPTQSCWWLELLVAPASDLQPSREMAPCILVPRKLTTPASRPASPSYLYLFPRITLNYYKLVDSHNRNWFSHSSGGQRSEIKGLAGPCALWRL